MGLVKMHHLSPSVPTFSLPDVLVSTESKSRYVTHRNVQQVCAQNKKKTGTEHPAENQH